LTLFVKGKVKLTSRTNRIFPMSNSNTVRLETTWSVNRERTKLDLINDTTIVSVECLAGSKEFSTRLFQAAIEIWEELNQSEDRIVGVSMKGKSKQENPSSPET